MIRIICLGKLKNLNMGTTSLVLDYQRRISKYHKIEIVELKDSDNIAEEESAMLKAIKDQDYVIALDVKSKNVTSEELASLIDKSFLESGTIDFLIGSSNGLGENVLKRANKIISFGDITMPHGLFRVVLLEQIYRAFKINNNETYHK